MKPRLSHPFVDFTEEDMATARKNRDAYEEAFIPKFARLLKTKNPRHRWETDLIPKEKFDTTNDSNYLFHKLRANLPAQTNLDFHDYKEGFKIAVSNGETNVKILPACEDYYFRDWKKNGICVKSTDIFIRRAYAIITPESVKIGDVAENGWLDDDEGLPFDDEDDAARYIWNENVSFSGCPPGAWYETEFEDNPDDETREQKTYHLYNATPQQEIEIFKKIFPGTWKKHCPNI